MKKILIIDDQQLVLLSLHRCLSELGYEVKSSDNIYNAIEYYDSFKPDLVITDINMTGEPYHVPLTDTSDEINRNLSGLEVLKYIRFVKKEYTPVIILSGNIEEDIIATSFELGANDYMKKPVSLTEIGIRVGRLIGNPILKATDTIKEQYIQKTCIGVVIPCYNEEERLLSNEFRNFIRKNLGYHLCFVNDGSKDNTLQVLKELQKGYENNISIYNCEKNGGKAEAVRLGMLHLAKQKQFDYIGFLDADLSTDFVDFDELVKTITNSNYKVVSGSRISRMGANITKESARKIISMSINYVIRKTLGMEFRDTQCGAKIMTADVIKTTFHKKFLTKWLFDVEIFMRMKKIYGKDKVQDFLCEKPLNRWIHADGSKLSFKDSFKIVGQIGKIALHYR